MQKSLAARDVLHDEYTQHVGSGHVACPASVRKPGEWWGQALFG
ncbi:hypothetical protein [Kitasatospora sp. NPDC050543]